MGRSEVADDQEMPRPFDVRTIRYLVRLMSNHDISEINLAEGDQRIRIRRGPRVVQTAAPIAALASAPSHAASAATPTPATEKPASKLIDIKSPTVGTFYAQRDPGSPPFVTVGSRVNPATVVCLIEAMKVYNDIQAEVSGVIREVCINNKESVEFNTVLFRVDPLG
jgi:acetyl-CoA carboxylase biotin carboxyl carrier protein